MTEREATPDAAFERLRYELGELVAIARALSSERDLPKLLGLILEKSRQVTGADAGSVYIVEGDPSSRAGRVLHFMLSQNDSLGSALDTGEFRLAVDERSIVGKAVLDARSINIPDLYRLDEPALNPWGFQHNRSIDERTGYRARSMLTMPMLSAEGRVIGVIQLINKKRAPARRLLTPEDFDTEVVPFDVRAEEFALAVASQAGLCLENAMLYDEIRRLFDGFVEASVSAIESRDPTTSGHSRRVATLSVGLARAVDADTSGAFREIRFDRDALRQIEIAGVLHDFGKVGVRERVLVKAKKLHPEELEALRLRFALIRRSQEAEALEEKISLARRGLGEADDPWRAIEARLAGRLAKLDDSWSFLLQANEPTLLEEGGLERLAELAELWFVGPSGQPEPYITSTELAALQVRRGSLTPDERREIESHVVHTQNFLRLIPWGKNLARVPEIASRHHEYMNGAGYPAHLGAESIPLETRIMTLADIFDALTASDRPYKRAVPAEKALGILEAEVKAGKCDGQLFDLFVGAQIYKQVL